MPRQVNYCPYCGAAQLDVTAHPGAPPQQAVVASVRQRLPEHPNVVPAQAGIHAEPAGAALSAHKVERVTAAPDATAAPAPLSHEWGASARPNASAGPRSPASSPIGHRSDDPSDILAAAASRAGHPFAAPPNPPPATPSLPPQRDPIRLRWWLLALAALWMVWFMAKPTAKKIDARIDHAISLATECKSREAQAELIALRQAKASAEQLQRLQDALNDAAAECRRQRKRSRAWSDAGASAAAPPGAADGVGRPRAPAGRQGSSRARPHANREP
jgi:hypothetical protein